MLITELFTSAETQLGNPRLAYPIDHISSRADRMSATARMGRRYLEIDFVRVSDRDQPRVLEISFSVDGSMGITGDGDAIRIFNTVLVALDQFLKQNPAPDYFVFGAEDASRIRLYDRMLSRFLDRAGYQRVTLRDLPREVVDNWAIPYSATAFVAKRIQKESQPLDEYGFTDYPIDDALDEEQIDEFSYTSANITNYLKEKGYKWLGSGVDQTAFLTPNGQMVLKIFGTGRVKPIKKNAARFSADQLMFFQWADYCAKNSSNPFLPRFITGEGGRPWAPFDFEGRRYLQIWQERLYKLDQRTSQNLSMLSELPSQMEGHQFTAREINSILTGRMDDLLDTYEDYFFSDWDINLIRRMVKQYGVKKFLQLFSAMGELDKIANKNHWVFDLHEGNFLRRQNGHPVIADPWVVSLRRAE